MNFDIELKYGKYKKIYNFDRLKRRLFNLSVIFLISYAIFLPIKRIFLMNVIPRGCFNKNELLLKRFKLGVFSQIAIIIKVFLSL